MSKDSTELNLIPKVTWWISLFLKPNNCKLQKETPWD